MPILQSVPDRHRRSATAVRYPNFTMYCGPLDHDPTEQFVAFPNSAESSPHAKGWPKILIYVTTYVNRRYPLQTKKRRISWKATTRTAEATTRKGSIPTDGYAAFPTLSAP